MTCSIRESLDYEKNKEISVDGNTVTVLNFRLGLDRVYKTDVLYEKTIVYETVHGVGIVSVLLFSILSLSHT